MSSSIRAVLDANVLFSASVRDLFLSLADAQLFAPIWSDRIMDEWIRNLLIRRSDLSEKKLRATAVQMDIHFPTARMTDHEKLIPNLNLPDLNDRHVLAAAIHSHSTHIVTFNLSDFPEHELVQYAVVAIHPNDFLELLHGHYPKKVRSAFAFQIARLSRPPVSPETAVATLERANLTSARRILLGEEF